MSSKLWVCVLAMALGGTAACSPGGAQPQPETPGASANRATASPPPPTGALLKTALLTVQDVPTGYAVDASPNRPAKSTVHDPRCRTVLTALDAFPASAQARAEVKYSTGGSFGGLLGETLGSYHTSREPAAAIDAMAAAVRQCNTFTSVGPDGTTATNRAATLSFPALGDQTYAVRFQITSGGFTLVVDLIAVRIDRCVATIAAGGFAPTSPTVVESVTRKAVTKLDAMC